MNNKVHIIKSSLFVGGILSTKQTYLCACMYKTVLSYFATIPQIRTPFTIRVYISISQSLGYEV